MFLKALDTIVYRFRKPEALLSHSKQNIAFGGTKTPIFGLKEVDINLRQNHIIRNTSVYTETYPVTWTLNSPTTSKQNYPAFFKYFSVPPKKEILEYFRILYSTSGMNTPATTEQRSILSKIPNPIPGGSLSSNILLSGMPSTSASIPLLSRTTSIASGKAVPVYNLLRSASSLKSAYSLKSTSSIISQITIFTKKFGVPSNTETKSSNAESLMYKPALKYKFTLRYKPASVSQFFRTQKPDGQKISQWKTARTNLSPGSGKRRSANTGNFLQKISVNSLERENNNLQVNKNIDTFTEAQMRQRFFSDSVLSSRRGFIKGIKWKKTSFITSEPEKIPQNKQGVFNGFLFRTKILTDSEEAAGLSRHPGAGSTYFAFSRKREASKPSEIKAFGPSVKGRSELMYAGRSTQKTGGEDFVYGTSETFLEEVKKIKKIILETREIVADHLESHSPQVTGTAEQVMDVEYMSEKIMQAINHRLKIEAERRGIF